jgi:hypothetical protein
VIDERERYERAFGLFEMPEPALDRLLRRGDRKRRTQRIAAGVVGIAVFVAAIWIVTSSGSLDQTRIPAAPGVGTGPTGIEDGGTRFALPPEGAVPSTPETGELIITMHARPGDDFPSSFVPVHQVWVYADGRVITRTEGDPPSYLIEGLFEQRLTPEGVDLLLSRLLSTGLFERDGEFTSPRWGTIQVRDGDRWISVGWGCAYVGDAADGCRTIAEEPTAGQRSDLIRLSEGLADLASWLPGSAWESRDRAAYVPSRYAICYRQSNEPWRYLRPSRVSGFLPVGAQDLLLGEDQTYEVFSSSLDGDTQGPLVCSEVSIEEARALEEILTGAGFLRPAGWALSLTYRGEAPDPIGAFDLSFEPILPHGRWELMAG